MLLDPYLLERAYLETRRMVRRDLREKIRKRRYNALKKAFERLIENPYIDYESGKMLILSDSVTENGEAKFYVTSRTECRLKEPADCLCHAFWEGFPCWHRASLEIVENYLLIENHEQKQIKKTVDGVDGSAVHAVDSFAPLPNSFAHPQSP